MVPRPLGVKRGRVGGKGNEEGRKMKGGGEEEGGRGEEQGRGKATGEVKKLVNEGKENERGGRRRGKKKI